MSRQKRFSPEVKERVVRLVAEFRAENDSQWSVIR